MPQLQVWVKKGLFFLKEVNSKPNLSSKTAIKKNNNKTILDMNMAATSVNPQS